VLGLGSGFRVKVSIRVIVDQHIFIQNDELLPMF